MAISMLVLQVLPTLFFYRTIPLHIYGGGKVYLDSNMKKKTGRSDHFLQGTECKTMVL